MAHFLYQIQNPLTLAPATLFDDQRRSRRRQKGGLAYFLASTVFNKDTPLVYYGSQF